jgi:hypothetical protein
MEKKDKYGGRGGWRVHGPNLHCDAHGFFYVHELAWHFGIPVPAMVECLLRDQDDQNHKTRYQFLVVYLPVGSDSYEALRRRSNLRCQGSDTHDRIMFPNYRDRKRPFQTTFRVLRRYVQCHDPSARSFDGYAVDILAVRATSGHCYSLGLRAENLMPRLDEASDDQMK